MDERRNRGDWSREDYEERRRRRDDYEDDYEERPRRRSRDGYEDRYEERPRRSSREDYRDRYEDRYEERPRRSSRETYDDRYEDRYEERPRRSSRETYDDRYEDRYEERPRRSSREDYRDRYEDRYEERPRRSSRETYDDRYEDRYEERPRRSSREDYRDRYDDRYEERPRRSSRETYDDRYDDRGGEQPRRSGTASGQKTNSNQQKGGDASMASGKKNSGRKNPGKKRRARKGGRGRILPVLCAILILLTVLGGLGGLIFFEKNTGQSLMSCIAEGKKIAAASTAKDFQGGNVSYIYSADGEIMADLSLDNDRVYLTYDQLPRSVVDAFVSIEDRTFWKNKGTDPKGIARVLFNFVRSFGKRKTGASTITQQVVKLTYLSSERTLSRKVKEIVIARDITKKYTKEEIMSFYCNACCFANGIYGINDASEAYFGKKPEELTLSEAAYLCAIPNWPEHYNPRTNPDNALSRRDKILKDMLSEGYISQDDYEAAVKEEMNIHSVTEQANKKNFETTYAINCAAREILKRQGFLFRYVFDSEEDYQEYQAAYDESMKTARHELSIGGYRVYTSIDPQAQSKMQQVLDEALAEKDARLENGIYQVQGAMTVIDNRTGKVVAVIGGRTQEETAGMYTLNRAYQGFAQPGSSIKPLVVYAPAMDSGEFHSGSRLQNIDVTEAKEGRYSVSEIREMTGDSVVLRRAVEKSLNGCAYWLFSRIGVKTGLSYIQNMEFSRIVPDDYNMSACLGGLTHGVTTEEMANAYYTLENGGTFVDTDCILSMQDSLGNEIYEQPVPKDIYTTDACRQMTGAMKGVLTRGTAASSDWYDYTSTEAAGKTGTTNDNKAAWFCGYTPYYTMAVWVGCDTPTVVNGLNGNSYPLTIWKKGMLKLIEGLPTAALDSYLEEEEAPECSCELRCAEDSVNEDCPACSENISYCVGVEATCICEEKCEGDSLNELCPICLRDPEQCLGTELMCTCPSRCTEFTVNDSCPFCMRDWTACQGEEVVETEEETRGEETDPEDPPEPDEPDPPEEE